MVENILRYGGKFSDIHINQVHLMFISVTYRINARFLDIGYRKLVGLIYGFVWISAMVRVRIWVGVRRKSENNPENNPERRHYKVLTIAHQTSHIKDCRH